jgi:hypothetical protein
MIKEDFIYGFGNSSNQHAALPKEDHVVPQKTRQVHDVMEDSHSVSVLLKVVISEASQGVSITSESSEHMSDIKYPRIDSGGETAVESSSTGSKEVLTVNDDIVSEWFHHNASPRNQRFQQITESTKLSERKMELCRRVI